MLTQERLKEVLNYNPITGVFKRLIYKSPNAQIGDIVGNPDKDGYLEVCIDRKKYKLHRLAFLYMDNYFPEEVEHDNRIKFDNRWCNLKSSNRKLNQKNLPKQINNTSGFTGVYLHKPNKTWTAKISVNNKSISLGYFKTKEEAIIKRKEANIKYKFHNNHGV